MKIRWNLGQVVEQLVGDAIFAWIALPVAIVICTVIFTILTIIGLPTEISIALPLVVMVAIFIVGYARYQRLSVGPRAIKSLKRLLKAMVSKIRET